MGIRSPSPTPSATRAAVRSASTRWFVGAAVVTVGVAVVVVLATGGDGATSPDVSPDASLDALGRSTVADDEPASTAEGAGAPPGVSTSGLATESRLPWPDPPIDHEPHLLAAPGNGPLVADGDGLALLYVNSIGRATLLDLATGQRTEIEVSPARLHDRVAVEGDGFRSVVERRNVELAGPGAIVVHLHQPTLLAGWSGEVDPGLHLCLSTSCIARDQYERFVDDPERPDAATLRLERLDVGARPDIGELLVGDAPTSGRFRLVDTPAGEARVPIPIGGSIWVVTSIGTGAGVAEV